MESNSNVSRSASFPRSFSNSIISLNNNNNNNNNVSNNNGNISLNNNNNGNSYNEPVTLVSRKNYNTFGTLIRRNEEDYFGKTVSIRSKKDIEKNNENSGEKSDDECEDEAFVENSELSSAQKEQVKFETKRLLKTFKVEVNMSTLDDIYTFMFENHVLVDQMKLYFFRHIPSLKNLNPSLYCIGLDEDDLLTVEFLKFLSSSTVVEVSIRTCGLVKVGIFPRSKHLFKRVPARRVDITKIRTSIPTNLSPKIKQTIGNLRDGKTGDLRSPISKSASATDIYRSKTICARNSITLSLDSLDPMLSTPTNQDLNEPSLSKAIPIENEKVKSDDQVKIENEVKTEEKEKIEEPQPETIQDEKLKPIEETIFSLDASSTESESENLTIESPPQIVIVEPDTQKPLTFEITPTSNQEQTSEQNQQELNTTKTQISSTPPTSGPVELERSHTTPITPITPEIPVITNTTPTPPQVWTPPRVILKDRETPRLRQFLSLRSIPQQDRANFTLQERETSPQKQATLSPHPPCTPSTKKNEMDRTPSKELNEPSRDSVRIPIEDFSTMEITPGNDEDNINEPKTVMISECRTWEIEKVLDGAKINEIPSPNKSEPFFFRKYFFQSKTASFYLGSDSNKGAIAFCMSHGEDDVYRAALYTKFGNEQVSIPKAQFREIGSPSLIRSKQQKMISTLLNGLDEQINPKILRKTINPDLQKELLVLEERQVCAGFKFGLVYAAEGQTREDDMFGNTTGSPNWEKFLSLMGEKVALKGWDKYNGGLDIKNNTTGTHSLFTNYLGREVMFHVTTMLPYDRSDTQKLERKRHVGNDICVIIFVDGEDTTYSPSTITSHFNHVLLVVHPVKNTRDELASRFRVSVCSKEGVPAFGPKVPSHSIHQSEIREFILNKLLNGEAASLKAPVFSQKLVRTREALLSYYLQQFR